MGPYEVMRVLGEGAFARTLEARHRLLGSKACLKVGRLRIHDDALLAEARILWDLHHPSLPTLRDVFWHTDGALVLALRLVEGTPLDRAGRLEVRQAGRILGRLLRALRMLHFKGIVHNDIKPANIILEPDRREAVLVDFGMSSVRPRSRTSAPGYTPAFVAPELEDGRPPTPESDLYALGMTMMDALGGDIEDRVPPEGVPEPLLKLLRDMTRRDAAARCSWEVRDPLERLEGMLGSLR